MDQQLIETVTRLVLEKLKAAEGSPVPSDSPGPTVKTKRTIGAVKVWDHVDHRPQAQPVHTPTPTSMTAEQPKPAPRKETPGIAAPKNKEQLQELMKQTPARIGIGRAGLRPKTDAWLAFRSDHAAAVDAVYGTVADSVLERLQVFRVTTRVGSKEEYILRPDLGRRLSEEAKETLRKRCKKKPRVQIVFSDGLSSQALEANAEDTYLALAQSLAALGIETGTPFFVERGRVAVMDDIGEVLEPDVIVLLIGERPGLVSAESLSAYLCYRPRRGMVEADRMVISNIHAGGIPPVEAGAYLGDVVQKILKYEASGVSLVQKEQ
ncbi:ethanolamine ammonia-lyase subunit EutC [Aneurinibacillus sp. BA2021]|nr:ethanolamine ammonia-lyase subunit EutC [Aneurinibacillus sp. BA2021]